MNGNYLIGVCLECDSVDELRNISYGDEGWQVCGSCESVEGRAEWLTEEEFEERQNKQK